MKIKIEKNIPITDTVGRQKDPIKQAIEQAVGKLKKGDSFELSVKNDSECRRFAGYILMKAKFIRDSGSNFAVTTRRNVSKGKLRVWRIE